MIYAPERGRQEADLIGFTCSEEARRPAPPPVVACFDGRPPDRIW